MSPSFSSLHYTLLFSNAIASNLLILLLNPTPKYITTSLDLGDYLNSWNCFSPKCDRVVTVMSLLPLQSWKNVSAFTGLQVLKLLSFSTLTQQQSSRP